MATAQEYDLLTEPKVDCNIRLSRDDDFLAKKVF